MSADETSVPAITVSTAVGEPRHKGEEPDGNGSSAHSGSGSSGHGSPGLSSGAASPQPPPPSGRIPQRLAVPGAAAIAEEQAASEQQQQEQQLRVDRYGFEVPAREDSEARRRFEAEYRAILSRREAKWRQLLGNEGGDIPAKSSRLKRFVRKGIPMPFRGRCWLRFSGGEKLMAEGKGRYEELLRLDSVSPNAEINEVVDRDLHRTMPDHPEFRCAEPEPDSHREADSQDSFRTARLAGDAHVHTARGILSLRRVLLAFARHRPDIGYCQSLNFLAAVLVVVFTDLTPSQPSSGRGSPRASPSPSPSPLQSPLSASGFSVNRPHANAPVLVRHSRSAQGSSELLARTSREEHAFWTFVALVTQIVPEGTYTQQMTGASVEQRALWEMVGRRWPWMRFKIDGGANWGFDDGEAEENAAESGQSPSPSPSLPPVVGTGIEGGVITMGWFLTCFANSLPSESLMRTWDLLFYEGIKALYQIAAGVLKIAIPHIKGMEDPFEMVAFLQSFPRKIWNCQELIEMASSKPRARTARITTERLAILRKAFRIKLQRESERRAKQREAALSSAPQRSLTDPPSPDVGRTAAAVTAPPLRASERSEIALMNDRQRDGESKVVRELRGEETEVDLDNDAGHEHPPSKRERAKSAAAGTGTWIVVN